MSGTDPSTTAHTQIHGAWRDGKGGQVCWPREPPAHACGNGLAGRSLTLPVKSPHPTAFSSLFSHRAPWHPKPTNKQMQQKQKRSLPNADGLPASLRKGKCRCFKADVSRCSRTWRWPFQEQISWKSSSCWAAIWRGVWG